jgi:hypothetical protein
MIEQIAGLVFALAFFVAFGSPPPFISINSRRRHHHMHMRMIIQSARMGVQYTDGARLSLQLWIVLREGFACPEVPVSDSRMAKPKGGSPSYNGSSSHRVCADVARPADETLLAK